MEKTTIDFRPLDHYAVEGDGIRIKGKVKLGFHPNKSVKIPCQVAVRGSLLRPDGVVLGLVGSWHGTTDGGYKGVDLMPRIVNGLGFTFELTDRNRLLWTAAIHNPQIFAHLITHGKPIIQRFGEFWDNWCKIWNVIEEDEFLPEFGVSVARMEEVRREGGFGTDGPSPAVTGGGRFFDPPTPRCDIDEEGCEACE